MEEIKIFLTTAALLLSYCTGKGVRLTEIEVEREMEREMDVYKYMCVCICVCVCVCVCVYCYEFKSHILIVESMKNSQVYL